MIKLAALLAATLALGAAQPVEEARRFSLPQGLEEISGLAIASNRSVFAHNDEHAIVYEIELERGRVLRAFALGDPTLEGDFEGIARLGNRVFLITSDGLIYAAQIGRHRQRVAYTVHDSGIGPRCEIEGLSESPNEGELLILCKRARRDGLNPAARRLTVYRWSIDSEHAADVPFLSLALSDLLTPDERPDFRPSGIDWDTASGEFHVVSGRNRIMLTFDRKGALIEKRRLSARPHPMTEGIAFLGGRWMALADEGSATRRGRLTVYPVP